MLAAYRRLGADPPFTDPRRPHGVAMEGWFWRLTHVASGTVVVVFSSLDRGPSADAWGTVGVALHPGGVVRTAVTAAGHADASGRLWLGAPDAIAAGARGVAGGFPPGVVLDGDTRHLRVQLGDAGRVDVVFTDAVLWPRRAFGGIGAAQVVPGLGQYWHPYLLRARVRGIVRLGEREVDLTGAVVYAEKNWAPFGGFPPRWWWGQAQGFAREDLGVAFAGGVAQVGPVAVTAGALVVSAGGSALRIVRPLAPLRVDVGEAGWRLAGRTARGTRVTVEGHPGAAAPVALPTPLPAERRVLEGASTQHLAGTLRLTLRRGRRLLFDGTSQLAGLEEGRG